MSRPSPVFLTILVVGVAAGQWSEPRVVTDSVSLWAAGPALAATGGDSLWACWASGQWPQALVARCLTGDTWRAIEPVLSDSEIGVHWPAAVVDDSGHVMVAFFLGDYPIGYPPPDTWGIYTVTRGPRGWEDPVLAHEMMDVYPTDLCLGMSNQGTVGMAWSEDYGTVNSMDSVMFSRRTPTGWTERKCLAPGRYPDVSCAQPSLVAGDSNEFCLAFSRRDYPSACTVHVLALADTVVSAPTSFFGYAPALARDARRKLLVFADQDRVMGSVDQGSGWSVPVEIASGRYYWAGLPLCVDAMGCAWTCWYDSLAGLIMASYNRGHGWTEPETVATASSWLTLKLTSDGYGKVHCLWVDNSTLRHAYRLELPGVEERTGMKAEGGRMSRTICSGVLVHQPTAAISLQTAELVDIAGRRVMSLQPGPNDIRHIAPGVYFIALSPLPSGAAPGFAKPPEGERMKERGVRSAVSGERSAVSVRKVVIQR